MALPRMNDAEVLSICARTRDGRKFLIPTDDVNDVVEYAIGVACEKTGAKLSSCQVMINHYHIELIAPGKNGSKFCYLAHRIITDGLKNLYHRKGSMWDSDRLMIAGINDREGYARCVEYTQTNPIRDGVAKTPGQHLGFHVGPKMAGQKRRVLRPDKAFSVDSAWPDAATYEIALPTSMLREGETVEEMQAELIARVERRRREEITKRSEQHKPPAGPKTMRKRYARLRAEKAWMTEPESEQEKRRAWFGRGIPQWIAGSEETRKVLRQRHRAFLKQYRAALELWRQDPKAEVVFPRGTLKMAGAPNVRVSTEPPEG